MGQFPDQGSSAVQAVRRALNQLDAIAVPETRPNRP
jgi:hypothetical protein